MIIITSTPHDTARAAAIGTNLCMWYSCGLPVLLLPMPPFSAVGIPHQYASSAQPSVWACGPQTPLRPRYRPPHLLPKCTEEASRWHVPQCCEGPQAVGQVPCVGLVQAAMQHLHHIRQQQIVHRPQTQFGMRPQQVCDPADPQVMQLPPHCSPVITQP